MEYDKFGHCVLCHKPMITEQVIDGVVKERFTPEYREEELLMSDGSRMRVAMCTDCKATYSKEDYKKVMDCVNAGWEEELKVLNWDNEKKDKYRNKFYKLEIVNKTGNKPTETLEKELNEFHKQKR